MIKLTEEKSIKQNLIDLNNSLIVMKEAGVKDEEFFKSIYDKTLNDFLMRRYIKSFCLTPDIIKARGYNLRKTDGKYVTVVKIIVFR